MKNNDEELFDNIATEYAEKDLYVVSQTARKFQILSMVELLKGLISNTKFNDIVEIGCGNGANSKYLSNFYNRYTGFDFSKELIDIASNTYGNEKVDFIPADLMELDESKKYDLIVGVGILHHLPDLEKYLTKIKEIGTDDSLFLFLEPQGENPFIQMLRYFRKKIDSSYSESQVFFKFKELEQKFLNSGLEITKHKYTGYFTPPFAQIILKPAWLFGPILKILVTFDKFIQSVFPNKLSWNISFVAKRIKSEK